MIIHGTILLSICWKSSPTTQAKYFRWIWFSGQDIKTIEIAYLRKTSSSNLYDHVVNKDFVTFACTFFKKQIRKIQSVNVKEAQYNLKRASLFLHHLLLLFVSFLQILSHQCRLSIVRHTPNFRYDQPASAANSRSENQVLLPHPYHAWKLQQRLIHDRAWW